MVQRSQTFRMAVRERKTLRFTGTNEDTDPVTPIDYAADYASVRWALSRISPSGQASSSPVLEKVSTVAQPETGGNEIDFSGTGNNQALVQLVAADTTGFTLGDYLQQLTGFDANGEEVLLAEGTMTLEINLENA